MVRETLCRDCQNREAQAGKSVQDHLANLGKPLFDSTCTFPQAGKTITYRIRYYRCNLCDTFWSYVERNPGMSDFESVIMRLVVAL